MRVLSPIFTDPFQTAVPTGILNRIGVENSPITRAEESPEAREGGQTAPVPDQKLRVPMQRIIHTCVYNTADRSTDPFPLVLQELPDVQVVCEASSWEQVRECIGNTRVDLVLANLDPEVEAALQVVQLVVRTTPEMGVIGVSSQTDPQTIIKAMRMGCTQFVCAPIEVPDLENAISRIEATRMNVVQKSQRICLIGSAGGVGVTTIACNLALELGHLTERPAALVDLNLDFGDAAGAFDVSPRYTVADVCKSDDDLDRTMVEAAMVALPCNVHLLGRPAKLEDAHLVCPEGISQVLQVLSGIYTNVVVDLPRACSTGNAAAIEGADFVLVVAQLQVPSIRNAHRVVESLLQMGAYEDKIELVINRSKADHERISVPDVEESFGRPVFAMIPNDYRSVAAALDLGHPILADAPSSPARIAIHEMAAKIAKESTNECPASVRRKGLFARLLGKKETLT